MTCSVQGLAECRRSTDAGVSYYWTCGTRTDHSPPVVAAARPLLPGTKKAQSPNQKNANKLSISRNSKCLKHFKTLTQKSSIEPNWVKRVQLHLRKNKYLNGPHAYTGLRGELAVFLRQLHPPLGVASTQSRPGNARNVGRVARQDPHVPGQL